MNLHRLVTTAMVSLTGTLSACATVRHEEVEVTRVHVPTLERLCIDREGEAAFSSTARGSTRTCYLMPPAQDDGQAADMVRPEETVWSRVTAGAGGQRSTHVAHGQLKQTSTGSVRWVLGEDDRIVEASLSGPIGLSWRWDPQMQGLAQLDLHWSDRQVTISGRAAATRVQVGLGGAHFWESTVMTRPDEDRALEAWLADGHMNVSYPEDRGELAVFPICPLGEREVWDDWNGRFPRVMRCLRGDAEWLRIERDDRGRIVTIAERRLGVKASPERALRISWHATGLVPERVWVELDARKEGLEAHFTTRGVPEVTRIHQRGQLDGLAVVWERARARGARMYSAGVAHDLDLVTRWTEGKKIKAPPELKFGLRDDEPKAEADATLVWPSE